MGSVQPASTCEALVSHVSYPTPMYMTSIYDSSILEIKITCLTTESVRILFEIKLTAGIKSSNTSILFE